MFVRCGAGFLRLGGGGWAGQRRGVSLVAHPSWPTQGLASSISLLPSKDPENQSSCPPLNSSLLTSANVSAAGFGNSSQARRISVDLSWAPLSSSCHVACYFMAKETDQGQARNEEDARNSLLPKITQKIPQKSNEVWFQKSLDIPLSKNIKLCEEEMQNKARCMQTQVSGL